MPYQITQVADVGTGNPIVARLSVGLFDIIDMATLQRGEKEKIKEGCLGIMNALVQAEKAAKPLMDEIKAAETSLATTGVQIQQPSMAINTPGVMNLANAAVFLKFAKEALQVLAKTVGILLKKDFKGPHFDKVRDQAIHLLGADHVVSKLLQEDHAWIKHINDLRNEDEHHNSSKPFVTGFNITPQPQSKYLVELPRFFDGTQVLSALEVFSHNLLTFSEELLALMLANSFPHQVVLSEIPEEQRQADCPIRFRLAIKDGETFK